MEVPPPRPPSALGVRQPRHPAPPAEVGGHVQRRGADGAAHPVVLGGDGVFLQHREVSVPEICLGPHTPAPHHRRLQGPRLCSAGEESSSDHPSINPPNQSNGLSVNPSSNLSNQSNNPSNPSFCPSTIQQSIHVFTVHPFNNLSLSYLPSIHLLDNCLTIHPSVLSQSVRLSFCFLSDHAITDLLHLVPFISAEQISVFLCKVRMVNRATSIRLFSCYSLLCSLLSY